MPWIYTFHYVMWPKIVIASYICFFIIQSMNPTLEQFVLDHAESIDRLFARNGYASFEAIESRELEPWVHMSDATHCYVVYGYARFGKVEVAAFWSANSGWMYSA